MIETARLRLEPLTPAHADELFEGLREPRLYEFISEAPPPDVQALRSRYRTLAAGSPEGPGRWLNYAIRVTADGRYVGYVQATILGEARASIGYVLFDSARGQGFAREAVAALLDHLRDACDCREAVARVDARNAAS